MSKKIVKEQFTAAKVRNILLKYFYDKNKNATSLRGKKAGAANKISIIRKELKIQFGLTAQQIVSNLTYLISQGYVEEKIIGKAFSTPKGAVVPAETKYYTITAAGIDKIDGPTEYTRDLFAGIKIEATGQNIITLGDGNQINAKFEKVGNALNDLKDAVKNSDKITDTEKIDIVVDIESIQNQLAKPVPNKTVIQTLWKTLGKLATVQGVMELYSNTETFITELLQ